MKVHTHDRAAWMKETRWGVMVHYLADWKARELREPMTVEKWNDLVDHFDDPIAFLEQCGELEAERSLADSVRADESELHDPVRSRSLSWKGEFSAQRLSVFVQPRREPQRRRRSQPDR